MPREFVLGYVIRFPEPNKGAWEKTVEHRERASIAQGKPWVRPTWEEHLRDGEYVDDYYLRSERFGGLLTFTTNAAVYGRRCILLRCLGQLASNAKGWSTGGQDPILLTGDENYSNGERHELRRDGDAFALLWQEPRGGDLETVVADLSVDSLLTQLKPTAEALVDEIMDYDWVPENPAMLRWIEDFQKAVKGGPHQHL